MPTHNKPPYREPGFGEVVSTSDALSEDKIIAAFIAGDLKAFRYVYNKYRDRIFSYCLYVTGNKMQADDAFQEVFIRVYQRREQLREAKALKSWLLLIARSVCLNLARESKFTPEFIYLDNQHQEHDGYTEHKELSIQGINQEFPEEIFQIALRKIAPIYRDAFLLREIEGFTYEEVAELTGSTLANVKVRIARAKKMLRDILAPHFKDRLEKQEKQNPLIKSEGNEVLKGTETLLGDEILIQS